MRRAWVEAPGAAPGSEWFIATVIYFHSRRTGSLNIGGKCREKQGRNGVSDPEHDARLRRLTHTPEVRLHPCQAAAGCGMNSDPNPIWTLAWTFGLMSLFAVRGANAAIPENAPAVNVHRWMTDKQFADVFAISQCRAGRMCRS